MRTNQGQIGEIVSLAAKQSCTVISAMMAFPLPLGRGNSLCCKACNWHTHCVLEGRARAREINHIKNTSMGFAESNEPTRKVSGYDCSIASSDYNIFGFLFADRCF